MQGPARFVVKCRVVALLVVAAMSPASAAVALGADPPPEGSARVKRLRKDTMLFLIRAQWLEGEAAVRSVKVAQSEVRRSLAAIRRRAFPRERRGRVEGPHRLRRRVHRQRLLERDLMPCR